VFYVVVNNKVIVWRDAMGKAFRKDDFANLAALDMAQKVAWQLRELAKTRGYDPKGIKVFTKGHSCDKVRADAQISWKEGPAGWTSNIVLCESDEVWVEPTASDILSFYNI
jgi:hypothetical protein